MTTTGPTFELRLAPMAGVTNAPFRLLARECGAGLLTSEEIDARALIADNAHTRELAHHLPEERPLAMQLLGADPDVLAEAARRLEAAGADAIDLNMGCPVAKIVAKGQGAALMRDPWRAAVSRRFPGQSDRHTGKGLVRNRVNDDAFDGTARRLPACLRLLPTLLQH